jgi:hypothetical protein
MELVLSEAKAKRLKQSQRQFLKSFTGKTIHSYIQIWAAQDRHSLIVKVASDVPSPEQQANGVIEERPR